MSGCLRLTEASRRLTRSGSDHALVQRECRRQAWLLPGHHRAVPAWRNWGIPSVALVCRPIGRSKGVGVGLLVRLDVGSLDWTQDLHRHLHVHALMACGALQFDAGGTGVWIEPRRSRDFLFPVHALSRVFRGKFLQALRDAIGAGRLPRDPSDTDCARHQRVLALRRHDWVVYAKTQLAGPAAVLITWRATHTVRPSATSGWWLSTPTGCA